MDALGLLFLAPVLLIPLGVIVLVRAPVALAVAVATYLGLAAIVIAGLSLAIGWVVSRGRRSPAR